MGGITGQQLDLATGVRLETLALTDIGKPFGSAPSIDVLAGGGFGNSFGADGPTGGGGGAGVGGFGVATMIIGTIMQAVGSFYSSEMSRERFKMHADQRRFQQEMSAISARAAEGDAQLAMESGQREIGRLTLGVGAAKAARRARAAASGIRLDAGGSAAEVEASLELVKQIDVLTIRRNTARAAGAARTRRTNIINEGLLAGVSARNLDRSAGVISPVAAGATTLIGNAGNAALQLSRDRRLSSFMQTI